MRVNIHSSDYAQLRTNSFVFSPVRGRNRAKSFELVPGRRASISMAMKPTAHVPILVTNELAFIAWINQAMPGDVLEYHRGFLAFDVSRLCEPDRAELLKLAHRAMRGIELGLVHLVQRRNGPNDFSYLAIARPKPKRALASRCSLLLEEAAS
jgi:hypothetical protein